MSFARTKIQPPRQRPGSIARPALEARLDAALRLQRLVLVIAPAGFGKTAALTRQIARLPEGSALAWVSCDEDDDLQRLLACLCAALEPYDPPWRSDPETLGARAAGSRSQRREAADELLNTLAACEVPRGVIVFDDLHRITDPALYDFIELLLPDLPPHWVLVLAGRETPPLALARLHVQGELAEFRESELQFDAAEVEALLQATPGAAARVAPQQLLARTQGWAVGLRLALSTLSDGRPAAGALRSAALDRHVFDYLAAEVLQDMPDELRLFLLRCSVLPELSAGRCEQVARDPRAARWLEEIEARGLFVSTLEGPELTLRLHDLFRDFLEDRLGRELPAELPELLKRAAAGEEDTVRRIGWLLRAGAAGEACTLLCEQGPLLMTRGTIAPVLRMIEQFPRALRDGPRLQLLRGQGAWALWDFDTMYQAMHAAAAGHARRGERDGELLALAYEALALCASYRMPEAEPLLSRLHGEQLPGAALVCVLHVRVWQALDFGPFDELATRFGRELDEAERLDTALLWYHASPVARYLGAPGMVAQLQRFVHGAMRHCQAGATPLRVLALTMQAFVLLWAGRNGEAEAVLASAEDDARWLGGMRGLGVQTHACRVLLHALRGEADAARAAMRRPRELLEAEPDGPRRRMVLAALQAQEARLSAWLDDLPRLRELIAQLERMRPQDIDAATNAQRAVLPAYLADAEGQPARAIALRRAALQHEDRIGRLGLGVETRLRLAAAVHGREGAAAAAACLQPALQAIDDATELAAVLLAGPAVLRTLAEADWGGHLDAGARARLQHWAAACRQIRRGPAPAPAGAARPAPSELSAREAEVLEHIAAGDSNKLIARALDLSPHTVKRHVANILDKIGVQTRGQAAAWYRQHG
ncbi:MAG TPA: LuxR C-terminal-related transcriptional regulator [Rubrivivax sp.]|nr:LuxR C-terminal-related transcriptional regulator [Rubrivivax sp.]